MVVEPVVEELEPSEVDDDELDGLDVVEEVVVVVLGVAVAVGAVVLGVAA